jgi:HEPN domain-containing protein
MGNINYKDIAAKDLKSAEDLLKYSDDNYNLIALLAEQYVEKLLKHCIETKGATEHLQLLSIHNLTKMYDVVVQMELLEKNQTDRLFMSQLKDYYFDTNYPGDNYRELDYDEANSALEFAKSFGEKLMKGYEWRVRDLSCFFGISKTN